MKYSDFERIMSVTRMNRYLIACGHNSKDRLHNRIAHHEPVCFLPSQPVINTTYARQQYNLILQLFQWMNIDEQSLLYGLDHITTVCDEIELL